MTKLELIQVVVAEFKVPVDDFKKFLANYPDNDIVGSQAEAFALYGKYRSVGIDRFRDTAWAMVQTKPRLAAREVINQMKAEGIYIDYGNDKWTGKAFAGDGRFEKCGLAHLEGECYGKATEKGRRAHGAYDVNMWRIISAAPVPAVEVLHL